jgi:uncharacterized protein YbbK (DUF523 family)
MEMKDDRQLVGVSRCLLGDRVRYDGKAKTSQTVVLKLSRLFELVPVCPEVEAGLPVPRPPVKLVNSISHPSLIGRDDPSIDITVMMQQYCNNKMTELNNIKGFIFKSRSPSCGLNSTPVFKNGKCLTSSGRGIFAKTLCETWPDLPVIEDNELEDKQLLEKFILAVQRR